jgi:predicted SAM-dependent methyltransferase
MSNDPVRVNVGCGSSPTPGWLNYDGSPSVKLACHPRLCFVLDRIFGLLEDANRAYIAFVRRSNIQWADATKRIPLASSSVDVLYSSHMIEHLDREEAKSFLAEARRVLKPNGIVRVVVPDLRIIVQKYCQDGNADSLVERTLLPQSRPRTMREKIKWLGLSARSKHRWMYDAASLSRLLSDAGFSDAVAHPPGSTSIPDPGDLNLREREIESVYVEARK